MPPLADGQGLCHGLPGQRNASTSVDGWENESVGRRAEFGAESVAVGYRAAEAGHLLEIERDGKRFRVACQCGFRTGLNANRKAAFGAAYDHAVAAARGDIPNVLTSGSGVSFPETASRLRQA